METMEEVLMYHTSNRVIFRNRDVGYMDYGDDGSLNVFVSEKLPRHVMQKYQSFGASKGVIDFVMAAPFGARKIRFIYAGKNLTYPKV